MAYSNIGSTTNQRWVEVTTEDLRDLQGITGHDEYRAVLRRNHQFNNTPKGNTIMAKKTAADPTFEIDLREVLVGMRDLLDNFLMNEAPVAAAPTKSKVKPSKAVEDDEPEDDDEDDADDLRTELEGMKITALRKEAINRGFNKAEVAEASKEDLIDSILADEEENGGDDEDDEDESDEDEADEDEEGDEGYTEEDLNELSLTALKKIAKDEFGYTVADLRGLDKEEVIDTILSAGDEDSEDEEDEDEDEEDFEESLNAMSLAEVKVVAKQNKVKVQPGQRKTTIIKAIMAKVG